MHHALTIDVEDWYQGIPIPAATKASAEKRLEASMDRLLGILEKRSTRATFFILGPVAEDHAGVVERIAAAGHEIGCHGWSHDPLYE
ncbi:MAG: polysaccharide deacetylase family protein, partial [Candidatus Binatia bacterium]